MVFEDVVSDPRLEERLSFYAAEDIRSMLVAPLHIRGCNTGSIAFYYRRRHQFSEFDTDTAATLANLAGSAITNAELYEEQRALERAAQKSRDRSEFLAEASRVLASSLDYEVTLASVAHLALGRFADWCAVDVADGGELPRRLAIAHADPAMLEWAEEFRRRYPPVPTAAPLV